MVQGYIHGESNPPRRQKLLTLKNYGLHHLKQIQGSKTSGFLNVASNWKEGSRESNGEDLYQGIFTKCIRILCSYCNSLNMRRQTPSRRTTPRPRQEHAPRAREEQATRRELLAGDCGRSAMSSQRMKNKSGDKSQQSQGIAERAPLDTGASPETICSKSTMATEQNCDSHTQIE